MDQLQLFEQGTQWVAGKVPAAVGKLDDPTPCDDWDVRTLLNHMLDSQRYFREAAQGQDAQLPQVPPPDLLADDPVSQYDEARASTLRAYSEPGVIDRTGPALAIAFVDQLVHGWDLARATGQDATMPDELAQAAFAAVDGQLTDDRRGTAFKPAVPVPDDASAQDRLLGYGGRQP